MGTSGELESYLRVNKVNEVVGLAITVAARAGAQPAADGIAAALLEQTHRVPGLSDALLGLGEVSGDKLQYLINKLQAAQPKAPGNRAAPANGAAPGNGAVPPPTSSHRSAIRRMSVQPGSRGSLPKGNERTKVEGGKGTDVYLERSTVGKVLEERHETTKEVLATLRSSTEGEGEGAYLPGQLEGALFVGHLVTDLDSIAGE